METNTPDAHPAKSSPSPHYHMYRGIMLPTHNPPEIIENLQSFEFRPDDILIITSPKSGTHWATELTGLILADGVWENVKRDTFKNHIEQALLTKDAFDAPLKFFYLELDKMPSPRVMFTHLPLELLPPEVLKTNVKIIYVARNPKDVLASLFRFASNLGQFGLDTVKWEDLFASIFTDNWFYGAWDRHVLSYWKLRTGDNVLFLKYEDMKKKTAECVSQIADFICHPISDAVRDDIVEKTSISSLKKEMDRQEKLSEDGYMYGKAYGQLSYFQKGVIGNWKNYFTVAQNELMDRELESRFGESGLCLEFE